MDFLSQLVWWVDMSYRNFVHFSQRTDIPAFGFLPGREVKDAGVGNLGLQDRE